MSQPDLQVCVWGWKGRGLSPFAYSPGFSPQQYPTQWKLEASAPTEPQLPHTHPFSSTPTPSHSSISFYHTPHYLSLMASCRVLTYLCLWPQFILHIIFDPLVKSHLRSLNVYLVYLRVEVGINSTYLLGLLWELKQVGVSGTWDSVQHTVMNSNIKYFCGYCWTSCCGHVTLHWKPSMAPCCLQSN